MDNTDVSVLSLCSGNKRSNVKNMGDIFDLGLNFFPFPKVSTLKSVLHLNYLEKITHAFMSSLLKCSVLQQLGQNVSVRLLTNTTKPPVLTFFTLTTDNLLCFWKHFINKG